MVILLIPTAALFIYRRRARSELRENRIKMEAELELERDVSGAKDELVAGVSHQFRTPLTSIVGFTQVLLHEPDIASRHKEMIRVINRETTNLTRMVEDLLMAARLDLSVIQIESGRFEIATELTPLVAEARALGQEVEFEPIRATVRSDVGKFRHVTRNLLSNVVTHGGPRARVAVGTDRGRLFVTVADDGVGISPEIEHRIFTPFTNQGSRALLAGSVGMGLAVADALATTMDGSLRYERTADGWTEFTLWMPVGYSRIDTPEPASAPVAFSAGPSPRVE
jgi:signal transduction histidine kinase